ncbi:MAG: TonB family protein [Myxococcales bacterium]|nr:TonB family protein [Myxococcales bacterium]
MTTSVSLVKGAFGIGSATVQNDAALSQIRAQAEDSGARAVEVTAVFDGAVQQVRHFVNPQAGKMTLLTKGVLALSAVSLGAVMTLFGASYLQVSVEKSAAESSKQSTVKPLPQKDHSRDVAAGTLLMLGAAGLAYGVQRIGRERGDSEYSVGADPQATYQVSTEGLPCERFPLVRGSGSSFELVLAESMNGTVVRDGKQMDLREFAQCEKAARDASLQGAVVLPISQGVRYSIEHGGSTFVVAEVAKPRHYPVPLRVDWATQSYTGAVMAGAAAFVGLMFALPPPAKSLSLDGFDAGRLIKLQAKPEAVDERPDWLTAKKKEEIPKQKQAANSNQRNHTLSAPMRSDRVVTVKHPGPVGKKEQQELAVQQATQAGIVGLMKSGMMATILTQDSALGHDARIAMDGLVGVDLTDPYSPGGGLVAASGPGGGGDGTVNTTGIGPFGPGGPGGRGGGPRGPALGPYRQKGIPTTEVGRVEVNAGSMDREVIRRVIRSHMPEVKFCYERALMAQKDLSGRVQVKFMISPTGKVTASIVDASTLRSPTTEHCVAEAVRRWDFPKPPSGIVSVTYPFVFRPAGE